MPHKLQHLARAARQLFQSTGIPTHPRTAGSLAAAAAIGGLATWLYLRAHRPTAEQIEQSRRNHLMHIGRLTDGTIVDARTLASEQSIDPALELLLYRYRIAGVTYDCAQDVSVLSSRTAGYRLDQPVQVRYDPRNPGNSIIVAEDWSGLWQAGSGQPMKAAVDEADG